MDLLACKPHQSPSPTRTDLHHTCIEKVQNGFDLSLTAFPAWPLAPQSAWSRGACILTCPPETARASRARCSVAGSSTECRAHLWQNARKRGRPPTKQGPRHALSASRKPDRKIRRFHDLATFAGRAHQWQSPSGLAGTSHPKSPTHRPGGCERPSVFSAHPVSSDGVARSRRCRKDSPRSAGR